MLSGLYLRYPRAIPGTRHVARKGYTINVLSFKGGMKNAEPSRPSNIMLQVDKFDVAKIGRIIGICKKKGKNFSFALEIYYSVICN